MTINKINFSHEVIQNVISEIIKKIPLIDISSKPIIESDNNTPTITISVTSQKNTYSIYNSLCEIQDLVYYKLKDTFDLDNLKIIVKAI